MDARAEEEITTIVHNLLLDADDFFDDHYSIEDWIGAIKGAARDIQEIEDKYGKEDNRKTHR